MKINVDQQEVDEIRENWQLVSNRLISSIYKNSRIYNMTDFYAVFTNFEYGEYSHILYLIPAYRSIKDHSLIEWCIKE